MNNEDHNGKSRQKTVEQLINGMFEAVEEYNSPVSFANAPAQIEKVDANIGIWKGGC